MGEEVTLELSIGGIFRESNRLRRRRKREETQMDEDAARKNKKERIGKNHHQSSSIDVNLKSLRRAFQAQGNMNLKYCLIQDDDENEGGGCQRGVTDNSRSSSSNSQVLDQQLPTTRTMTNLTETHQPNTPQPTPPSFLARMPCVSTTGNGPNGRTVGGFLSRYTKNEVSIVCVCHGNSFSPAGFVEHAGGVNILHPLKHITIFPTA